MYGETFDPKEVPAELRDCFEEVETICLEPWRRVVERGESHYQQAQKRLGKDFGRPDSQPGNMGNTRAENGTVPSLRAAERVEKGWQPGCRCDAGEPIACTVLDPFAGAGTTLLVADRLGRDAIGCELNPEYAAMIQRRITGDCPMFASIDVVGEVGQIAPPPPNKQDAAGNRTYTGFNARWKAKEQTA